MSKLPPSGSWSGSWGSNKPYKSRGNWGSDRKPPSKGCGGKKKMFGSLFIVITVVGVQLNVIVQTLIG